MESVVSQTYDNWELIVIDDCSSDGSSHYLSSLTNPRIKVIRNEKRKFCSSSYAIALKNATGEICGVVDGDDVLDSQAMAVVHKRYIKNPQIDYIYTQHQWCDVSLQSCRKGLSSAPKKGRSLAESCRDRRHCFSHWRTFRTSMREKGTLFPEGMEVSVDKNMGFALEELGRGAFLPKSLYRYRYYKGNMSLVQGKKQKADTLRMAKQRLAERSSKSTITYPVITIT